MPRECLKLVFVKKKEKERKKRKRRKEKQESISKLERVLEHSLL